MYPFFCDNLALDVAKDLYPLEYPTIVTKHLKVRLQTVDEGGSSYVIAVDFFRLMMSHETKKYKIM